jgi:hypothetical protein
MLVTVRDAGHRREKMSEMVRTVKYKLNEKEKNLAVWDEEKENLRYLCRNGRRQNKGTLGEESTKIISIQMNKRIKKNGRRT